MSPEQRVKPILQIGLRDTGSGPARFVSRIFCLYYKDDESQSVYSVIKLNNSFIIFLTSVPGLTSGDDLHVYRFR